MLRLSAHVCALRPARGPRAALRELRALGSGARVVLIYIMRYKNKLYGFTTWIYHGAALANRGAGFAVQSALSAVTKVTPAPAHSPQPVWCCSAATSRYRPASSPKLVLAVLEQQSLP